MNGEDLNFETKKEYVYIFQELEIMWYFVKSVFGSKIILNNADKDLLDWLFEIINYKKKNKNKKLQKKKSKKTYS